jgi:hypothetical protein
MTSAHASKFEVLSPSTSKQVGWLAASLGRAVVMLATVGMLAMTIMKAAAEVEPLPQRTDIPADYSTVICPAEPQARRMLREFYVAGGQWFNGQVFMSGLDITGCRQLGGPLQIREVLERKRVVDTETGIYLMYRAVRPDGASVFGIVHESGNNRHPRNPEERWRQTNAPEGHVIANTDKRTTYVCPTPEAAMAVVAAIPRLRENERGTKVSRQARARDTALTASRCIRADGTYTVSKVHNSVFISLGYEAGQEWTALTVIDRQGRTVGLLYDSSQH